MRQLILHGDPGIRKDGIIEYDGEELVCFGVNRNGDWHGPDEPQLWCTVGTAAERETFEQRDFVPHFLDTETADAGDVDVIREQGAPRT